MKVLITGGAGYLGSVLVGHLLGAGHQVDVLDNFMFGQASLNHYCAIPGFEAFRGDARDPRHLWPRLQGADVLIPLAALVGMPMCDADQEAAVGTNFEAIRTALGAMSADQRVIIPITNSGYGIGEPGKECTEDTPMRPISLYGRTKVQAEELVLARGNAISLRLATVFGMSPRMRIDLLVNDFVNRAVTDRAVVLFEGHFKRNYIHVRDVARAFEFGIDHFDALTGEAYNVGLSDANLSKVELCERIKNHVPGFAFLHAPVGEDPDKRDYIVSNARIEAAGFKPIHSLDAGITELIMGFRMLRSRRYGNA
jgi:nucleoside-diphosphate-sugar epimerase